MTDHEGVFIDHNSMAVEWDEQGRMRIVERDQAYGLGENGFEIVQIEGDGRVLYEDGKWVSRS